jgi:hypothetical protein
MSLILDLNKKIFKYKISVPVARLSPPLGIFYEDQYTNDISISKELLFDENNNENIIKKLTEIHRNNTNAPSDINIENLNIIKIINNDHPKLDELQEIKNMSKNIIAGSNKPFFKIFILKTNNIKACYVYYTQQFNHSNLQIIGNPNTLYTLYFEQNQDNNIVIEKIYTESNKIFYGTTVNTNLCPQCPQCPQCPKCKKCAECPECKKCAECPECNVCPDTKPYTYGLYGCAALIFILLIFLFYNIMKGNKETKPEK